ncbi:MAG: hypothetical protein AB8B57_17735 [Congregibacter sp.]
MLVAAAQIDIAVAEEDAVRIAEGLWKYTGLVTKDGQSLPLTGIFLIKNGVFMQQSIFNGQPFASQGSMAHAGPYWAGGAGLRLRSNQTLSLDPMHESPLTSAGALEHDLEVTRDGDEMSLVFGGGTSTLQTFRHLGDANDTQIVAFRDGGLAFADDHFILVIGNDDTAITGYGVYSQEGNRLTLNAERWAASDGESVINLKDAVVSAMFDGEALTLPGGQRFAVID